MQNILKYIISILFVFLSVGILQAQDTTKNKVKQKIPVLNSVGVEVDLSPIVTTFINKDAAYSFEGAVNAEIFKKYFTVFEFGFAGANKTTTDNVDFHTNGFFGRIGADINLLKAKEESKPKIKSYITAGLRLGFSNAQYQINNIVIEDDYWNTTETVNYNQTSANTWFEIVASLRVEVMKNIYMGWSIRKKNLFTEINTGLPYPWYIPGFGISGATSNWGFNYCLGYRF
jgi:hypothetical protein